MSAALQTPTVIDLAVLNNPLLVGRDYGGRCRSQFDLDLQDEMPGPVEILIPESTYSISNSFFLGMFAKSIRAAGNHERFFAKYQFTANIQLRGVIEAGVVRTLLELRFAR